MTKRNIIEIDEEKCTGCGNCILACAEGALEIVDGKARVVGEIFCDGLGACLGECPEDALKLVVRDCEAFDEKAVEERLEKLKAENEVMGSKVACGCPSSTAEVFDTVTPLSSAVAASSLGHWPIKLGLLSASVPFLQGADLILLADCAAASYPGLHQNILPGRAVAMGCPKLDNLDAHIDRLTAIVKDADLRSLTVVYMDVPCCRGFVYAAQQAVKRAGADLPVGVMQISRDGKIVSEGIAEESLGASPRQIA